MWKTYILASARGNRAASLSIMAAALAAAFFLSLLTGVFYNLWRDQIDRLTAAEGDWHGRIEASLSPEQLDWLRAQPQVAALTADGAGAAVTLTRPGDAGTALPALAAELGLPDGAIRYHSALLSAYLVADPAGGPPSLLPWFYLGVLLVACFALVLMIRNAFLISMTARLRQLGTLASIGATPRQLRRCLVGEAALLSALPLVLGVGLGVAGQYGFLRFAQGVAVTAGRLPAVFAFHPLAPAAALLAALGTVLLSAWLPSRQLRKRSPLSLLRSQALGRPGRPRRYRLLTLLFGPEGTLAGASMRARRRALRVSAVSLTLSFLSYTLFLCFITLSRASTDQTYFARYRDAWDVMLTVPEAGLGDLDGLDKVRALPELADCVAYQRSEAHALLAPKLLSPELAALGGYPALAGEDARREDGAWVKLALVILDDEAFRAYAGENGLDPAAGAAVVNQVWDSLHSNFRAPSYIPLLAADTHRLALSTDGKAVALPLGGEAAAPPKLREEYPDYALVLVLPDSLAQGLGLSAQGVQVRLLAKAGAALEPLEAEAAALLAPGRTVETENRVREQTENDAMWNGYQTLVGVLCGLLALIGLTNLFANTLGFTHQRAREFAGYRAIGLTPGGMARVLLAEGLVTAGRPLLITLPLTVLFVVFATSASHMPADMFLAALPVWPVAGFLLGMALLVALAFWLGGNRLRRDNLSALLRDETLI